MARPLRIQYPGAVYHVTCRGNERKEIFRDDVDRKTFLNTLIKSLEIYSVKLHSYVLMENHFHLLVETPLGNVSEFMRHFNITYTSYYNRRYNRVGHLYQGRYKSVLVDRESYFSALSRYIHLNPLRTDHMQRKSSAQKIRYLKNYPWSSLPGYLSKDEKEGLIDYSMILGEYGGDNERGRRAYGKVIAEDVSGGIEIKSKIVGQSIMGSDTFIQWVKVSFIKGKKSREYPAVKEIRRYRAKEEILQAIEEETGKEIKEIRAERGDIKRVAMDLLYRLGHLTGPEIGEILGVDYTTVSQGRRRLREKMNKDKNLRDLMNRLEHVLSR